MSASVTRVFISPNYGDSPDKGDGGIRRVVEAQRRYLPDYGVIVVDTPAEADVLALHAGNWLNPDELQDKPVVAHCHGLYWEGYDWQKWHLHMNQDVIRTVRQADVVTAPSKWVADSLKRGMWVDAIPIYHGIYPEDWATGSRGSRDDSLLQFVLWNKNRPDPICDPAPVNELAKLAPDVQFITTFGHDAPNVEVIGTEPYLDALDRVHTATVYMATSRETFGIGTIEAMAAGVPILGWRWGGQAEFIRHTVDGWLAPPGDYASLLDGLYYCIENRTRMGAAARQNALQNFDWRDKIEKYATIYHGLAARRSLPKVAVVVPYHNLADYVADTLKSVATQTFRDFVCAVVDDQSDEPLPHEAKEIIRKDPRFLLLENEKNEYLAETLNNGIRATESMYVLPLDADNALAPNALEVLVHELDTHRELDIAYGKIEFRKPGEPPLVSDWPPYIADPDEQLRHRNQVPSTSLYRRRTWERIGGYRRRCHTAEDADFWTRALTTGARGKRVTDAVTLIYNDRPDSMSHVQKDWDWHFWYGYATNPDLRIYGAGGRRVLAHEFPKISVVIPVGPGHERYVLDALDSLQNQSTTDWEAIVVNDTMDDLLELPPWAKVVATSVYGGEGAATARNRGLAEAKGDYVLFLDADDWLHPRALRDMQLALEQKGPGNFIYTDWFKAEDGSVHKMDEFDPEMVLRQLKFPVTCMYYRNDLYKHDIHFDEQFNGKGWEDWDFAIQVVAQHGMCGHRLPAPLLHYRMDSGNLRMRAFENRETMKQEMYAKWEAYMSGKVQNMGCGGCGGFYRGPRNGDGIAAPTGAADPSAGETTMLEYLGTEPNSSRRFLGRSTGTGYRFGTDTPQHRTRPVFLADVPGLMQTGLFKQVQIVQDGSAFAPLEAKGPPRAGVPTPTTVISEQPRPAVEFRGGAALAADRGEPTANAAATPPAEPLAKRRADATANLTAPPELDASAAASYEDMTVR